MKHTLTLFTALLLAPLALHAAGAPNQRPNIIPEGWDPLQAATFHEHQGAIWLSVTQGDTDASRKERIMFGKLEDLPTTPGKPGN